LPTSKALTNQGERTASGYAGSAVRPAWARNNEVKP